MAQQTGPDLQRGLWAQVASFRPFQFLNSIIKRPQVEQQNGQDLPTDLWAHVASFLPPRDLGALFSVNRSAYAAKFILDLEFIINKLSEQAISNTLLSNEARETLMEKLRIIHQSLPDEYKLEFLNQLRVSICTNNFNFGLQQDMPYVIKTNFIPNIMKLCMYSLNSQGIMPSYEAIKPFFLEADNPKISNIPIIVEQFKRILKQISEGELTTDTVLDYIYNPQIIRHLVMHNNAVVHLENLFSAMTDAPQIVPLLMRHYNGDINKKGLMGFSLLGYAIRKNDIVAGDLLLARSDLVLDPKEDLLMMAILKMDVLWAQKLIKKGAIATEDHINSCISEGALEILNVLLDNNAVVHLKNLFSAMAHAPQVVPLLMQHYNGDINKKEVMGSSLLGYAIHKNDIVAGDLLLARSDLVLDPKEDLLMMAILKMDVLWAQSLIEKGAIVTEEVLEFCTILGTPEVLKVLLSNITYIPYEMLCKAQFHENPAIYKLYQEAYIRLGAPDVNEYMQDGYTPLTGDKPMNDHDLEGLLGQNPGQQEYTS